MNLGKRQNTILGLLNKKPSTGEELSDKSNLDLSIVKTILMEFMDAELIIRKEDGSYSLRDKPTKSYDKEPTQWQPLKLKNLSRIL